LSFSIALPPGGPRIIESVAAALELPAGATAVSAKILAERRNMSSPSVLFVLDRLPQVNARRPCVAQDFGPGLVADAALLV
jgi:predicted naringenin-chalcone synthase